MTLCIHYSTPVLGVNLQWRAFRHGCQAPIARRRARPSSRLAVERQVAASTQNQALAALLFLYEKVLRVELPWLFGAGLRRREALMLRVKDVQFDSCQLIVRSGT